MRIPVMVWVVGAFATALAIFVSIRFSSTEQWALINLTDGTAVWAEIADSPEERRTGLSDHAFLGPDRGMLFLFDEPVLPSFWMKDMDFPIDIIWISGETVVGVAADVPVPAGGELPGYGPETPVDAVLEVNAGFAAAHGIGAGDRLDIDLP